MNIFPTIAPPLGLTDAVDDPMLESTYESGHDATRPQFTAPRWQPSQLTWDDMTTADLDTLLAFWRANRGREFIWRDPATSRDWRCRFVSSPINWTASRQLPGRYEVDLKLRRIREVV
ncbi:DUF2460 domain-containing protein [Nitratidesulfovibrio vulgaris]|uniref:DUF2460 domain-containing protein n=1 Tax=Nitratidesulfovibrio vulgaris TaxID=881 RepID=UPI0013E065F6|nr:DUF2460 domain-containing protein [Nitratidesulfovibrio vulgaris]